jgi:hypothetical protein
MANPKELTLVDCTCGSKPVLTEFLGVMTKSKLYVYKCPSCGQTGEMFWPNNGEIVIKSWNHTIKTKIEHVKFKS